MSYFLCRLNPPRPTFTLDMTDAEQALMGEHGVYWTGQMGKGNVAVFGVVMDPASPWGVTIVEADDEAAARALTDGDPAVRAGAGFSYDVFAMPNAIVAG